MIRVPLRTVPGQNDREQHYVKARRVKLERDPNDTKALAEPDALVTIEKQRNGVYEGRNQLWFDERALRFCDSRLTICEPYAIGVDQ